MKRIDIKSALVGALLTAVILLTVSAATTSRTDWEYRVVTARAWEDELTKTINENVADGWEFVSASGPNDVNWGIAVLRRERR